MKATASLNNNQQLSARKLRPARVKWQARFFACLLFSLMPGVSLAQTSSDLIKQADEFYQAQDWAKAAAAYEGVTKAEPSNGRAWYRLGVALHSTGKFEQAIAAYQKSVQIGNNPFAIYNTACSYARLGDKDKAFEWLNKAINAGFTQPARIKSDTDFDSLRSDARFEQALRLADKLANPCMHTVEYKQFDFWVGDWNVHNQQGQQVGTNTIQRITGDCIILENWTDGIGRTGKSINFYDANKGKWRQTWVSDNGGVSEYEGEYKDGAMRFMGETVRRNGAKTKQRLTFFNLAPDRVRQFAEQSTDDGKTWTVAYDFIYTRKK